MPGRSPFFSTRTSPDRPSPPRLVAADGPLPASDLRSSESIRKGGGGMRDLSTDLPDRSHAVPHRRRLHLPRSTSDSGGESRPRRRIAPHGVRRASPERSPRRIRTPERPQPELRRLDRGQRLEPPARSRLAPRAHDPIGVVRPRRHRAGPPCPNLEASAALDRRPRWTNGIHGPSAPSDPRDRRSPRVGHRRTLRAPCRPNRRIAGGPGVALADRRHTTQRPSQRSDADILHRMRQDGGRPVSDRSADRFAESHPASLPHRVPESLVDRSMSGNLASSFRSDGALQRAPAATPRLRSPHDAGASLAARRSNRRPRHGRRIAPPGRPETETAPGRHAAAALSTRSFDLVRSPLLPAGVLA